MKDVGIRRRPALLSILVLLLAACGAEATSPAPTATDTETTPRESGATAEPAAAGGVHVALSSLQRELLDAANDGSPGLVYQAPMYDFMVGAIGPDGTPELTDGVLESIEPNSEQDEYLLTLKQGIHWHDGVEMTSEDIKFTMERYSTEGLVCTGCGTVNGILDRVEIVDEYSARVILRSPYIYFPDLLAPFEFDLPILPSHHFAKVGVEGGFEEDPLGSGPWILKERRSGEFIEWERNPDYWNPARAAQFDTLRLTLVPELSTRLAGLRQGEFDLVQLSPSSAADVLEEGFQVLGPEDADTPTLVFYNSYEEGSLFADVRIRKAFALAIDMEAVVDAFYPPEVAELFTGSPLMGRGTLAFDPELPAYEFDPDEARRLLDEAGYAGEEILFWSYSLGANPEQLEINEVLAGYLRDVGLNVNLTPVDFPSWRPRLETQDFGSDTAISVAVPRTRPGVFGNIRTFMASGDAGGVTQGYFDQERADSFLEELNATLDPEERAQKLLDFNRSVYEEYWAIPIAIRDFPWGVGERVCDWDPLDNTPDMLRFETLVPCS